VQVLGSRRGGLVTLVIAGAAFAAAVAFAVLQLVGRPSVDAPFPAPGSAIPDPTPAVEFSVDSGERLGDLRVLVDGRDMTARVRGTGGRLTLAPGRLRDGDHRVDVRFSSDNVFARTVQRSWVFQIDTAAPRLAVASPAEGALRARRAVKFSGRAEAGATVTVAFEGGAARASADGDGAWSAVARLPEGEVATTVTAADRAGNATDRRRSLVVDTTAPEIAISEPAAGAQLTETDQPLVYGSVGSESPRRLTFTAKVNGRTVATARGIDATAPEDIESSYGEVAGTEAPPLEIDGRRFAIGVGTLRQGKSRITVAAKDRAGNVARTTTVVNVDSTEEFGPVDLGPGARGADVVALQERLREAKVFPKKGKLSGRFDKKTARSVLRYQKRYDMPVTGLVDARTRHAMVGRLVVNLTQKKVRLIRNGKVWKAYPIAIGQPAYPTPTGEYEINDKQVDPAWYPPDSPWAAELTTIPPGPGNPLGTRWIGTTAPAVGLHGTYAGYTVGTAASHGCMRMHIPDVEELYEQVVIGMKISIRP
jgi:lipoprotein-anchoring transpeptidase ErfK/SrfK